MTFQFACRKWLSHKDLEPAGPANYPMNHELITINHELLTNEPRTMNYEQCTTKHA